MEGHCPSRLGARVLGSCRPGRAAQAQAGCSPAATPGEDVPRVLQGLRLLGGTCMEADPGGPRRMTLCPSLSGCEHRAQGPSQAVSTELGDRPRP